jgi:hypothetical protein
MSDLLQIIDALLKDIEAEAREQEAKAKADGERITTSEANKRAISRMMGETE